jgi:hypothetical protein
MQEGFEAEFDGDSNLVTWQPRDAAAVARQLHPHPLPQALFAPDIILPPQQAAALAGGSAPTKRQPTKPFISFMDGLNALQCVSQSGVQSLDIERIFPLGPCNDSLRWLMHNKSISPSYAEDLASGTGVGAAGRRRTPPPRLIYTTTVAQQKVTWSACIMPYGSVTWGDGDTYSGPGDWATTVQRFCELVDRTALADPPPSPDIDLNSAAALPASWQALLHSSRCLPPTLRQAGGQSCAPSWTDPHLTLGSRPIIVILLDVCVRKSMISCPNPEFLRANAEVTTP